MFICDQRHLSITTPEHLAALTLPSGRMIRLYATCCGTVVGNMMPQRWIPFFSISITGGLLSHNEETPNVIEQVFGPVRLVGFPEEALPGEDTVYDAFPDPQPKNLASVSWEL